MKWLIFIFLGLIVLISITLIILSLSSRKEPELGIVKGQLLPCVSVSNCVCSEFLNEATTVKPFSYNSPANEAWAKLKTSIRTTGGRVIAEDEGYLRAVYETPIFRFLDDVEFRHDIQHKQIQVRSASRVGRSDLGANRNRVEKIRRRFNNQGIDIEPGR